MQQRRLGTAGSLTVTILHWQSRQQLSWEAGGLRRQTRPLHVPAKGSTAMLLCLAMAGNVQLNPGPRTPNFHVTFAKMSSDQMIQRYAVTSATSGLTTVAAAYQTTCTQYYRIATMCGSASLVDCQFFSIHFWRHRHCWGVEHFWCAVWLATCAHRLTNSHYSGSALPTATVASGHNNSDSRTKKTVKLVSMNFNEINSTKKIVALQQLIECKARCNSGLGE